MNLFELGRHEAQIAALGERLTGVEHTVNSFDQKLDAVVLALAEKRGERRALAYIGALAGAVVSLIVTIVARAVLP